MHYLSPFHFIELPGSGQPDKKAILLARKKMLAELELNDGHGIVINGKEVSKNDIIRFFDELQQSADLSYHIAVYEDKVLLKLLEYNILENKEWFVPNPLYTDALFIEWIGPYYATSFAAFAGECYQQLMDKEWMTLLGNPVLMNGYAMETAWTSLEKLIRLDINRLNLAESGRVAEFTKATVKGILDFRRVEMLVLLPVNRFEQVRDELAFTIMKLSIKMFNHVDRKWGLKQVEQAHALAASERMKDVLDDKRVEMETIVSNMRRSGWKPNFIWKSPRLIIIVLILLGRAVTCNMGSNSSNSPRYAPVTFIDSGRQAAQLLADSLSKKPETSSTPLSDSDTKEALRRLINHGH